MAGDDTDMFQLQGGSSRSRLLQDDLVSVKHQLQDAQEQVQHRSESLVSKTVYHGPGTMFGVTLHACYSDFVKMW